MPECRFCGASLGASARFCPECGTRVEDAGTAVQPLPVPEGEPGPTSVSEQPRWFGVTPPMTVFGLAVAALAVAVVLFVLGHWVAGIVVLAVALLDFAYFVSLARRRPDLPVARASAQAVGGLRARVGAAADAYGAYTTARHSLLRLRREHDELLRRREGLLRALGEAVYRADDQATERLRADLDDVDETLRAKEAEMTEITSDTHERLGAVRDEVGRTQLLEPPAPPDTPEPYPPPDEGTPPMPPPIPEPYPPPDEGTPPQPDPSPGVADPEEVTRENSLGEGQPKPR